MRVEGAKKWPGWPDSNRRPPDPQSGALTRLRYIPISLRVRLKPDVTERDELPTRRTARARRCASSRCGLAPRWLRSAHRNRSRTGRRREMQTPAAVPFGEQIQDRPQTPLDRRQPLARVLPDELVDHGRVGRDRRRVVLESP